MNTPTFTREQWLLEAANFITTEVIDEHTTLQTPPYKLSIGWPHASKGKHRTILGQCFPRAMSASHHNEIFISPTQNDTLQVLLTLTHELIHAYDDCQSGHKGYFATVAKKVGFEPPLTSSSNASDALKAYLIDLQGIIGPIPHAPLDTTQIKKGASRQLKVECTNQGCDFKFRASQTMIDKMTQHTCLVCGTETLQQEQK